MIVFIIVGIALFGLSIWMLHESNENGILIFVFSLVLVGGIIYLLVTDTAKEKSLEVKTKALNHMISSCDVEVKTNKDGKLEYFLLDSTQIDLFNYLNSDLKNSK